MTEKTTNGALFGAVTSIAAMVAPDLELAPKDESEDEQALATRLLGELEPKIRDLRNAHDDVAGERDQLKRQVAAFKGHAIRARAEAIEAREAGKPRALGAPRAPRKGEEAAAELTAAEILELVQDGDSVEIVASDGKREIPGVPIFSVPGSGFVEKRAGQLMLNVESLLVTGPNVGAPASIEGFALLVDGEQVAWAPLSDPIPLGPGQQYELKDSVVFGVAETV